MLFCQSMTAGGAGKYFEHAKEYYTKNQSNYDRWHGRLAEKYGLQGEVSEEQFKELLRRIESTGRTRAGEDCTFSAPKSVSIACAKDEATRADMIRCHQRAVKRMADKIEKELLKVRIDGKGVRADRMCAAEFVHQTARPTAENDFVPDPDLHSHLFILNETEKGGKSYSLDFDKIVKDQKRWGLEYRIELAKELQASGYELEVTDMKSGFFELKDFPRELIDKYSSREHEVLQYQSENGCTREQARVMSRSAKDLASEGLDGIYKNVADDVFIKNKVELIRRNTNETKRADREGKEIRSDGRDEKSLRGEGGTGSEYRSRAGDHVLRTGQFNTASFRGTPTFGLREFAGGRSLSELPDFSVDAPAPGTGLLLPRGELRRVAFEQTERVRDRRLQREAAAERQQRIDDNTKKAMDALGRENFAFSVKDARERVMAANVLEGITEKEAEAAMERAELIKLGRLEGDAKNVYLTTQHNIEMERNIVERVTEGKHQIKNKVMDQADVKSELRAVEDEMMEKGQTDFRIEGGEQGTAVEHILTCEDRFLAVDGLAGTGKTTMIERLKLICDRQGIDVRGVCFTGKAAVGLEDESGVQSTTLHSYFNELDPLPLGKNTDAEIRNEWDFSRVRPIEAGHRELWIVDEAGMVDDNLMDALQRAAIAKNAQVVLLGDPDQLPPVGCGEPMRAMEENGMATASLVDIFRQKKNEELLKAVKESVRGDTSVTFEKLEKMDCYHQIENVKERRAAIVEEMTKTPATDYKDQLLLVSRNADRKVYNQLVRNEYVKRGELDPGVEVKITNQDGKTETRKFSQGERMIFLKNDKRLGVKNGTLGTVKKIEGDKMTVLTDGKDNKPGKLIEIDLKQYNKLDQAWAVTNYKAQGMTVTKVVADMNTRGNAQTRNALYVDISRAKKNAIVFTDDKKTLEKQCVNFAKKITSKDFAQRINTMQTRGVTHNDRYHAPTVEHTRPLLHQSVSKFQASSIRSVAIMQNRVPATGQSLIADTGKAVGQAIEAVTSVAKVIPVVGPIIAGAGKVAGKGVEVAAKVADVGVGITKGAAGMAKSAVQQAASAGLKHAGKEEPQRVKVRQIEPPRQSYEHDFGR